MERLIVAMNGIEVGYLDRDRSGAMAFRYLGDWLDRPGARPISLSLPLDDRPWRGDRVYNFFDNLLPDSDAIRARMQARFQAPTRQPFDLLAEVGRDCVGAIQLYPWNTEMPSVREVRSEPLTDAEVARLLEGYREPLSGADDGGDFRISLAGAQEKTALLLRDGQWHKPLGSTPTSHILKLPIGRIPHSGIDLGESVENEWLCTQICRAFGLPVADARMARFDGQKALVVERFDRRWSRDGTWLMRLPQEDFCQALGFPPALKYESDGGPGIADGMRLLLGSQDPVRDRQVFFRSQILFWLLAGIDGHGKNFSVFLEPGGGYRMTPLYDILSVYPLMASGAIPRQKASMAMAWQGKNRHYRWNTIQPRHVLETAARVDFSRQEAAAIMADLRARTGRVIERVARQLSAGFPEHISGPILEGLERSAARLPDD